MLRGMGVLRHVCQRTEMTTHMVRLAIKGGSL